VPGAQAPPPALLRVGREPGHDAELAEAYLANAVFDAHREDPEFGYRLLFDEVTAAGFTTTERTVCGSTPRAGPPCVRVDFIGECSPELRPRPPPGRAVE